MNQLVYEPLWTGPLPDVQPPDTATPLHMSHTQFAKIRKRLRLSYKDMAAVLGYDTYPSIHRFETGERSIPWETAMLLWMINRHGLPKHFKSSPKSTPERLMQMLRKYKVPEIFG